MKVVAVLLLATAALGWEDEEKMFNTWSNIKAMESCWGEDNMKTYMVQVKKAISKCHGTDAPELELPMFNSPFRFINTMMTTGQQHQENLLQAVQAMARNMAQTMMQKNGMQNNMMQNNMMQNQFQQQYQPNNQQGRNDMNYNTNQQYPMNNQGQKYRANMQSNNMPYDQTMNTVSMMKLMREFMEKNYNQNNGVQRNFRDNNNMDYSELFRSMQGNNMRYKRQANEDANTLPGFLELGDRLAEKLKETQEHAIAEIGNFTCVMKEMNVLNDQNQLDVRGMKKDLENYNLPSEWFKNHEIRNIDICYQMSEGVPQSVQDDYEYPGTPNLAKMKVFMDCCQKTRRKTCMQQDMKNKIENNFGPLENILEQTGLKEHELFPLMMKMLHSSEEMEYLQM